LRETDLVTSHRATSAFNGFRCPSEVIFARAPVVLPDQRTDSVASGPAGFNAHFDHLDSWSATGSRMVLIPAGHDTPSDAAHQADTKLVHRR
jgi:hypothetical protein